MFFGLSIFKKGARDKVNRKCFLAGYNDCRNEFSSDSSHTYADTKKAMRKLPRLRLAVYQRGRNAAYKEMWRRNYGGGFGVSGNLRKHWR